MDRQNAMNILEVTSFIDFVVKATVTPPLPQDFQIAQLLHSDMQLTTEVRPR